MADISLKVAGLQYWGWTGCTITRALNQIAGTFSLSVTDKYPGNHKKFNFRLGDSCTVNINKKRVITGYIDDISLNYSDGRHSLKISGRDVTGDLADCSHIGPPSQWSKVTVLDVAKEVCKPFQIPVIAEVEPGEVLDTVKASEGSTVLSLLARIARLRRLLLVSYGSGKLYLTRAGMRGFSGNLEFAGNIVSGQSKQSNRDRHSKYIVKGQGKTPPKLFIELTKEEEREIQRQYMQPKAVVDDENVKRYRPLVIIAGEKGDEKSFLQKAQWEAATRAGASRPATYTVQGWGPKDGGLWEINSFVQVSDAFLGINRKMLIEKVTYGISENGGSVSTLNLVHPDCYLAEPKSAKKIKGDFDF